MAVPKEEVRSFKNTLSLCPLTDSVFLRWIQSPEESVEKIHLCYTTLLVFPPKNLSSVGFSFLNYFPGQNRVQRQSGGRCKDAFKPYERCPRFLLAVAVKPKSSSDF